MRLNKSAVLSLAFVATLGAVGGVPASASASVPTGELAVVKVGYNARGNDRLYNRSKEYIDLRNTGAAVNVKGWFTQDAWADSENGNTSSPADCNTAIFTKAALPFLSEDNPGTPAVETDGLWLPAGDLIRVYTGAGPDTIAASPHTMGINKAGCGYYGHYLGNGGDTIHVKKADGTEVATFTYSFDQGYWVR